ncbi:MAG: hypothetical protein ACREMB_10845 [Candidatus Rokuibacteriota bacterium]
MHPNRLTIALGVTALLAVALAADAQPTGGTLRIASVAQWVVNQHRGAPAELRRALDGGVVDRTVFWWQRGVIQRKALVPKPVRVVPQPEAAALGGRGDFHLAAVRPPAARAAWAEVDVLARSARPDDVLVLEIGGDLNVATQVLETLWVVTAGAPAHALPLGRSALVAADAVPVVSARFGLPVAPGPVAFHGARGLEFLVARSPVPTVVNGTSTVNGPADVAPHGSGEWREGDRVFIRIPLESLRAGAPAVVLGWKDRVDRVDPDGDEKRRARLGISALPR